MMNCIYNIPVAFGAQIIAGQSHGFCSAKIILEVYFKIPLLYVRMFFLHEFACMYAKVDLHFNSLFLRLRHKFEFLNNISKSTFRCRLVCTPSGTPEMFGCNAWLREKGFNVFTTL